MRLRLLLRLLALVFSLSGIVFSGTVALVSFLLQSGGGAGYGRAFLLFSYFLNTGFGGGLV